uniref:Uncharacterized protein n=1 Tax=Panagrolaimus sp. JU765 TaxID=591449 RepID=A0AC34Q6F0_9BILA
MTEAKMKSIMKLDSPHCFECRQHHPKTTNITEFDLNECQISNDSIFYNDMEFIDPQHKQQIYYCIHCLPSSKVTKIMKKISIKVTSEHCQECQDMRSNAAVSGSASQQKEI